MYIALNIKKNKHLLPKIEGLRQAEERSLVNTSCLSLKIFKIFSYL